VFSRDAIRLIARASQGLTRRINILADKGLLAAFAKGSHAVTAAEVRRAVRDSEFYRARSGVQKLRIGAVALAIGLILGWVTHVLLSKGSTPPSSQATAAPPPGSPRPDPTVAPPAAAPLTAPTAPIAAVSPSPGKPDPAPRALHAAAATPAPTAKDSTATPLVAPTPPAPGAQPAAGGKLARERFDATQEWLRGTPGDRYSIQLATVNAAELPQLESFLQKAAEAVPLGELFVYSVKIAGQQHYRVAYGSFPGPAQALQGMKGLPPLLGTYQPYARSVERMRSQNRQ
jgi:septal ring-binding cell division protein DamX